MRAFLVRMNRSGTRHCLLGGSDLPFCGMASLQGRARAMMECWHTKAERLPAGKQVTLRESGFPGPPPTVIAQKSRGPPPGAWRLGQLTKVGLLICPFEMNPFGRRLDEEVTDKIIAVLTWTKKEERFLSPVLAQTRPTPSLTHLLQVHPKVILLAVPCLGQNSSGEPMFKGSPKVVLTHWLKGFCV